MSGPIVSGSPDQTARIAAAFARELEPGDVVLLTGEVGAGKSTFARASLRELGVEGAIPSPTFTIGRLYEGRDGLRLAHVDLYRIGSIADEDPGLLVEYFDPAGVAFVEWPGEDRPHLLSQAARGCEVAISQLDRDRREIRIGPFTGPG